MMRSGGQYIHHFLNLSMISIIKFMKISSCMERRLNKLSFISLHRSWVEQVEKPGQEDMVTEPQILELLTCMYLTNTFISLLNNGC